MNSPIPVPVTEYFVGIETNCLHMYHFMFLCEPSDDETILNPSHKHESLIISWFNKDSLPTDIDPGHVSRIPEAFRVWEGDSKAYFDL